MNLFPLFMGAIYALSGAHVLEEFENEIGFFACAIISNMWFIAGLFKK